MFDKLKKIISSVEADYVDLRYEIKHTERAVISHGEIKGAGSNSGDGFVLRVLKDGGFSSMTFTKEEDAPKAIKKALQNAEILAAKQEKSTKLASVPVVKDMYKPFLNEDPRDVTLVEKIELIRDYSDLLFKQPKIVEVTVSYEDIIREKYFVSSEGSEIFEELVTTRLTGGIVSREGDLTQQVSISFGGADGFWRVRNREADILERAKIAHDLLYAKPVKAGIYKVILNPSLTGLFTHEAFGHFSEADIIERLPSMRERMPLGIQLGNDVLNIVDDASMHSQLGFYKYDDEGVPVRRTEIMTNGVLTARLHNRITAAEFNEPVSGHNIAEDFRYEPIIRMGNIFVMPGKSTVKELQERLGNGLYLCEEMGGETHGENFTFGANWGYEVKDGEIVGMVRDINMAGNLFETLKNISGVADDFELMETGGCGKAQNNIRSNIGGPHILIDKITIGGV